MYLHGHYSQASNPRCGLLPAVLMERIQRGSKVSRYKQDSERTFISTRPCALFVVFLHTYNLSQIANRKTCLEGELRVLKAKLIILFYFTSFYLVLTYLHVTSLELWPDKTLNIKFYGRNTLRTCVLFWDGQQTPIKKVPSKSLHQGILSPCPGFRRQGDERLQNHFIFQRTGLAKKKLLSAQGYLFKAGLSFCTHRTVCRAKMFAFFQWKAQLLSIRIYGGGGFVWSI